MLIWLGINTEQIKFPNSTLTNYDGVDEIDGVGTFVFPLLGVFVRELGNVGILDWKLRIRNQVSI